MKTQLITFFYTDSSFLNREEVNIAKSDLLHFAGRIPSLKEKVMLVEKEPLFFAAQIILVRKKQNLKARMVERPELNGIMQTYKIKFTGEIFTEKIITDAALIGSEINNLKITKSKTFFFNNRDVTVSLTPDKKIKISGLNEKELTCDFAEAYNLNIAYQIALLAFKK